MDTRKKINQPRRDQGIKMLERMVAFQKLFELGEDALFSQGEEAGWSRSLSYSEEFSRFIHTLYDSQFIITFDWMPREKWGQRYWNNRRRLQKADLLTLRLLLCAAARNDHFCEGYLGSLAVDGKLLVVMQRLTEILADLHSGQMVWSLVNCGPLPDGQRGELASFDNFNRMYWADPGRLLAGDYPGDIDSEMAMQKLAYLVKSGIGQVINLMEAGEVNHNGQPFLPYAEELHRLGQKAGRDIRITSLAIRDMEVPTEAEMIHILDTIDQALTEDRPVYVHCWGGHGRTGTVVGCYLRRHDLVSARDVLGYISNIRNSIVKGDSPSPQTAAQRAMVKNWRTKQ